jgi:hypothetical protein
MANTYEAVLSNKVSDEFQRNPKEKTIVTHARSHDVQVKSKIKENPDFYDMPDGACSWALTLPSRLEVGTP